MINQKPVSLWLMLAVASLLLSPQTINAQKNNNQKKMQMENNCTQEKSTLLVKRIQVANPVKVEQVEGLLVVNGIAWHRLEHAPWEDRFPYRPRVQFAIAHTGREILLAWDVEESCVRAVAEADGGAVWQDSCCELFIQPEGSNNYYNIECNCGGKLLVQGGVVGTNRPVAEASVMSLVRRFSTLGNEPFPLINEPRHWQLCEVIPVEAFFLDDVSDLSGMQARGNLYKCGDRLAKPHYLSMFPIHLPEKPAFHCPQFFGTLSFE